jgi:phosphohistidine phosphatase SixA
VKIYLMRHGHSVEGDREDKNRTLDSIGKDQLAVMRKFFKWAEVDPEVIICSPFARGRDSAEAIRRGDTPIRVTPALQPPDVTSEADPSGAWKAVMKLAGDVKSVLVMGHSPLIEPMLGAIAFSIEPSSYEFEHGSVAYINSDESRLRWIVTPKLAAHVLGQDPKDVENPPVFAEATIQLCDSLDRSYKAKFVDPLIAQLAGALRARWSRQFKQLKRQGLPELEQALKAGSNPPLGPVLSKLRLHDKTFAKTFKRVTVEAYEGGASHAEAQLGKIQEAKKKPQYPQLPGYQKDPEELEDQLDDTSEDRVSTAIEDGFANKLGFAAIVGAVGAVLLDDSRADTVALDQVSEPYHAGGADVVDDFVDDGGEAEKTWDAEDDACEICLENESEDWISADDSFSSDDDEPPAHSNCRCSVSYRSISSSILGLR